MADIYTVGIAVETAQLQQGTAQARASLEQLGAAEARLAQQTRGVSAATQQLGSQEQQTARATQQQTQAATQATGALQRQTQAAHQTSRAVADLRQQFLSMAATYLSIRALTSALRESVQVAMRFEALTAVLNMVNRDSGGAATSLAFVRQEADRLGSDVLTLVQGYTRLSAATQGTTFAGKGTEEMLQGLNAAFRAFRLTTQDARDSTRPLLQMFQSGTVQLDELRNELGTRVPTALKDMALAFNGAVKDETAMFEAMEKGRVTVDAARNAVFNLTQIWRERYTPAALEAKDATDAAFNRLGNAALELKKIIGEALLPGLGEVARAFTVMVEQAQITAGDLGQSGALAQALRQLGSLVIGLIGYTELLGKALAAYALAATADFTGMNLLLADMVKRFQEITALQTQLLSGGFAAPPAQPGARPEVTLRPVVLGAGKGKSDEEKAAEKLQKEREAFEKRLKQARDEAIHDELELVAIEAQRLGYSKAMVQEWTTFAAITQDLEKQHKALEDYDALVKDYHQEIQAIYLALEVGIDLQEAQERLQVEQLEVSEEYKKSLRSINTERREALSLLEEERARIQAVQELTKTLQTDLAAITHALQNNLDLEQAREEIALAQIARDDAELERLMALNDERRTALALLTAMSGGSTAGLGPAEAIETFRQRGMTQGVVEGDPGPIETRMNLVSEATSRFDAELRQARLDLLALGGPDVVETFDQLTIKRFGAAAEGLSEFEDGLFSIRDAAEEVTSAVLSALERLTEGTKVSFKDMATSIMQDLLRILQQKFLMPQLAKWTELAISAGLQLLRGGAGVAGVSSPAGALSTVPGGGLAPSQSGGPLKRGLTLVGEAGPEVIATRGGRSMVFPTSHPLTRAAVQERLPGRQFGGSLPGLTQLPGRQFGGPLPGWTGESTGNGVMPNAEKPAMPGSVPVGTRGVVVNINITTPDASSFLRSRGEIQRAMGQAVRQSQYAP